jgi:hypothetical protein
LKPGSREILGNIVPAVEKVIVCATSVKIAIALVNILKKAREQQDTVKIMEAYLN